LINVAVVHCFINTLEDKNNIFMDDAVYHVQNGEILIEKQQVSLFFGSNYVFLNRYCMYD
jgi:hypothetical protein